MEEEKYISAILVSELGWIKRFVQIERENKKEYETRWVWEDSGVIEKMVQSGGTFYVQGNTWYNADHVIAIRHETEKPCLD